MLGSDALVCGQKFLGADLEGEYAGGTHSLHGPSAFLTDPPFHDEALRGRKYGTDLLKDESVLSFPASLSRLPAEIQGLNGYRLLAYIWMISFHCLPSLSLYEGFLRNCDAGFFFIVSGLLTELSMRRRHAATDSSFSHLRSFLGKRVLPLMVEVIIISAVSFAIFPIPGGEGLHLLPYVFSLTLPFLESFKKPRLVWNPNPPTWFAHQIIFFWILHIALFLLIRKLKPNQFSHHFPSRASTNRSFCFRWAVSFALLILAPCVVLIVSLTPIVKSGATGWSFHPLPRLYQYLAGVWLAYLYRAIALRLSLKTHKASNRPSSGAPTSPDPWHASLLLLVLHILPDLVFCAIFFTQNSLPPTRYTPEFFSQWLWRSLGLTPFLVLHLLTFCTATLATQHYVKSQRNDGYALSDHKHPHFGGSRLDNKWSINILLRFGGSKWVRAVAPGNTCFYTFLLHFPLVWQPAFGKNQTASGDRTLPFLLALWLLSITVNALSERVWRSLKNPPPPLSGQSKTVVTWPQR